MKLTFRSNLATRSDHSHPSCDPGHDATGGPSDRLIAGFAIGILGACAASLVVWIGVAEALTRYLSIPVGDGSAQVIAYPDIWLAQVGLMAALTSPVVTGMCVMSLVARRVSIGATIIMTVLYGVVFLLPMIEIGAGNSGHTVVEVEQPLEAAMSHPVALLLSPVVFFGLPFLAALLVKRLFCASRAVAI